MARVIVGAVGLLGLVLAAGVAAAQNIQCGDTLGPGGRFTLPADLLCMTSPGLTVRDGAVLDLGGHLVEGANIAILLTGRGAVLQNGRTFAGGIADVEVAGEGGHTVQGLETGGDATDGIVIVSDHNRLEGNSGRSLGAGFWVQGAHNRLERNTGVGQLGFQVEGDHNVLRENLVPVSRVGFAVGGAHNQLRDNEVHGCGDAGIRVRGTSNRIMQNTVTDNGIDLIDTHADCDKNQWAQNVFETSRAGDLVNPDCIQ